MISKMMTGAAIVVSLAGLAAPDAYGAEPIRVQLRDDVVLELVHLKRLSPQDVVELRFKIVNESDRSTSLKDLGIGFAHQLGQISLIDFDARKKYGIGHAGSCLCSTFPERDGGLVGPRAERQFWAWFRPATQATLAVELPGFPPILGVRVE